MQHNVVVITNVRIVQQGYCVHHNIIITTSWLCLTSCFTPLQPYAIGVYTKHMSPQYQHGTMEHHTLHWNAFAPTAAGLSSQLAAQTVIPAMEELLDVHVEQLVRTLSSRQTST